MHSIVSGMHFFYSCIDAVSDPNFAVLKLKKPWQAFYSISVPYIFLLLYNSCDTLTRICSFSCVIVLTISIFHKRDLTVYIFKAALIFLAT